MKTSTNMTTPTPEQLQNRKEWIAARVGVHVNLIIDADCENFEAYHKHRLNEQDDNTEAIKEIESLEGIVSSNKIREWTDELRKVAALQEELRKHTEDTPMVKSLKQHLATVSKEEFEKEWADVKALNLQGPTVAEFTKDMFIHFVVQLQQQLTEANAEIELLKQQVGDTIK